MTVMKSHSHHRLEQKCPCSKSKNRQVYATSSGRGPPHDIDASDVSLLSGYTSKTSSALGDLQLGLAESDKWSVDSPAKESGYHSEESSVGHNAETPGNKLCRSHGCELHIFRVIKQLKQGKLQPGMNIPVHSVS